MVMLGTQLTGQLPFSKVMAFGALAPPFDPPPQSSADFVLHSNPHVMFSMFPIPLC